MQRPPSNDVNFVRTAVEEEVERDEEDYDIYLLIPSLELSSPSEQGPCLYGVRPPSFDARLLELTRFSVACAVFARIRRLLRQALP